MFNIVFEENTFSVGSLDIPATNAVARQKGKWEE